MAYRRRRFITALIILITIAAGYGYQAVQNNESAPKPGILGTSQSAGTVADSDLATTALSTLEVKGRAPKTGYKRTQFGDGWGSAGLCDVRNFVLKRDMSEVVTRSTTDCTVVSGTLNDPYTAKVIHFMRGPDTSDDVQIDHVVALSDAWQKGAQQLSSDERAKLANDPMELLAVDGPANQKKGDGDAATWLPPNKDYRCRYVARQIAVKQKYHLWVTQAEKDAIARVLTTCPDQHLPIVSN